MTSPSFEGGIALARRYFDDVVAPVLDRLSAPYAAARLGQGSDVLWLDDETSQDHDWGLRLQIFVDDNMVDVMTATLDEHLPESYEGHPIRFAFSGQDVERLGIDVLSPAQFAFDTLGFDPAGPITASDWLSVTGQAALEVTAGQVFVDHHGGLTLLRDALIWYPDDIWLYVIACDWQRLDQELPLMARAGDRGDELGSRVIAARLVDITVHLAFTLCRRWQPYSKWRGSMFANLPVADQVAVPLRAVLSATDWQERDRALCRALDTLVSFQAEIGLPAPEKATVPFWDRPYSQVTPTVAPALIGLIGDPEVRGLPLGVGSVEQRTDNVDILVDPDLRYAIASMDASKR